MTTVAAGLELIASGAAAPATGGGALTLTKVSGTGDATITYYAVRAPNALNVQVIGAGGGGGGAPTTTSTQSAFASGGGGGGYSESFIVSPLSTYAYAVGAGARRGGRELLVLELAVIQLLGLHS